MEVVNTLAYYNSVTFPSIKSFIAQTSGPNVIEKLFAIYEFS
jgi:hypothetical protein